MTYREQPLLFYTQTLFCKTNVNGVEVSGGGIIETDYSVAL